MKFAKAKKQQKKFQLELENRVMLSEMTKTERSTVDLHWDERDEILLGEIPKVLALIKRGKITWARDVGGMCYRSERVVECPGGIRVEVANTNDPYATVNLWVHCPATGGGIEMRGQALFFSEWEEERINSEFGPNGHYSEYNKELELEKAFAILSVFQEAEKLS